MSYDTVPGTQVLCTVLLLPVVQEVCVLSGCPQSRGTLLRGPTALEQPLTTWVLLLPGTVLDTRSAGVPPGSHVRIIYVVPGTRRIILHTGAFWLCMHTCMQYAVCRYAACSMQYAV